MTHTEDELKLMLAKMRMASNAFYRMATMVGNHPFIEFAGLMNEYIAICQLAMELGIDFTETSVHGGGQPLPMQEYHRRYLNEKLECIYGHSLDAIMGGAQKS